MSDPCPKCGAVGVALTPDRGFHKMHPTCYPCAFRGAEVTVRPDTRELLCGKCRQWLAPDAFNDASERTLRRLPVILRGLKKERCKECEGVWDAAGRHRTYFPRAGDAVHLIRPPCDVGEVQSSCAETRSCRILIPRNGKIREVRWADLRDLNRKNELARAWKSRRKEQQHG